MSSSSSSFSHAASDLEMGSKYCLSLFSYQRIPTLEVSIGDLKMGGNNPIVIQSMTTTDTMDTEATIAQSLRMVESGCELVRITAPSINEAENLRNIREGLRKRGCRVPLVADIHFTPNAAEVAARIVEKVRVNPGNYADKKKFAQIEYTDGEYQSELQRIHERFSPLVKICKEYGTAMRIGTNHGSLSDRIMSRYGDTPLGMVESALEFLRICEDHQFHNIVISMKASNPQVMVQAYRLLVQKMMHAGRVYPLHLGVTEAGEGEDGRIKSALGISTLLLDGIGDTVRVSLTEEPEFESPVARFLVGHAVARREQLNAELPSAVADRESPVDPFSFTRRETLQAGIFGNGQVPRVFAEHIHSPLTRQALESAGYRYQPATDKYNFSETAADLIYLGSALPPFELPGSLHAVYDFSFWKSLRSNENSFPLFHSPDEFLQAGSCHPELNFILLQNGELPPTDFPHYGSGWVWVLKAEVRNALYRMRRQIWELAARGDKNPIVLMCSEEDEMDFYSDSHLPAPYQLTRDAQAQLYVASQFSSLLVDGLADGVWVTPFSSRSNSTSFAVLQLARLRTTRTEYISCPSCGRTLFDLQETTARIRKRTEHLKGIKIGIMGCIVNGPGEMADADYGYVGVGPGKIALYRGKEVVERGVNTELAVDKLIDLIRSDGRWTEPSTSE